MKHFAGRLAVAMAVALAPLMIWVPSASAAQQVNIDFYFDLNGNGVKNSGESSRPPSTMHPNLSGWFVRVWFYKVDDSDRIVAETWENVVLGGSTTLSRRLSPGRWIAVLGQVDEGDIDAAPDGWNGPLAQTQPLHHQSIELSITPDGPNQTLRFGYGPYDALFAVSPTENGPSFRVRSDENFNQVADPGEPVVPDGTEFTLTPVHLRDGKSDSARTSGGTVTFPVTHQFGAKVFSVSYGSAAPPPYNWDNWGYSVSTPSTVSYLVHEDMNDDCDTDPDDGVSGACAVWGHIDSLPTAAVLPASTPVAGTVFLDSNGNGVRDAGEGAPDGGDLRLGFAEEGSYPDGLEPNAFPWDAWSDVGSDGRFNLSKVPKGNYVLQTDPSTWQVTTGPITVQSTGSQLGPLEVGITTTFVSGRLFVDTDADMTYDPDEETLPDVRLRTWQASGEAVEVLDETTTDAQGRFRLRVDPNSSEIEFVDELPAELEPQYRLHLQLGSAIGDVEHDLAVHPRGRPDEAWPAFARQDAGVRKLWWTEPEDTGSAPVTGYVLRSWEVGDGGSGHTPLSERCVTASSTFATGDATGDVTTVQAVNEIGVGPMTWHDEAETDRPDGPLAVPVDCATLFGGAAPVDPDPAVAPAAPTRTTVALRPRAVVVGWRPGPVGDDHGTPVEYVVRSRQGKGVWRDVATVSASTTRTTVTGLVPRTKYTFVVVARNTAGQSASSPARTVTAQAPPAAPRAVRATAKRRAVVVRWKPGVLKAKHGTTSRYLVQRKVGGTWKKVKSLPSKARQHRVQKLAPAKVVRFRVVAVGVVGRTPSTVMKARPRR